MFSAALILEEAALGLAFSERTIFMCQRVRNFVASINVSVAAEVTRLKLSKRRAGSNRSEPRYLGCYAILNAFSVARFLLFSKDCRLDQRFKQ